MAQFSQTTRSLTRDSSRLSFLAWGLGTLFLAGWAAWFAVGRVTVYEISPRARLEVRQSSHPLSSRVAGQVVSSTLAIGAEVRAGDVLVALDDSAERSALREAQTRLDTLPLQIASIEREIESREREQASDVRSATAASEAARSRQREADAAVTFARDYEQRVNQLGARGLAAPVDVTRAAADAAKLAASRDSLASELGKLQMDAQSRVSQHEAAIESLRHTVTSLRGEVATAEAALGRLAIDLEKHVVRAPVSGRLGEVVALQPGAYVTEGQTLASIVPAGDLIVVAEFDPATALGRVQPGQAARLRLDGFPWAQYGSLPATVSRVSSEIRDRSVRVEFALDPHATSGVPIQHGLPGSIEVSVERTSPATLVLRAAGLLVAPRVAAAAAVSRDPRP